MNLLLLIASLAPSFVLAQERLLRSGSIEISVSAGRGLTNAVGSPTSIPEFRGLQVDGKAGGTYSASVGKFVTPKVVFSGSVTAIDGQAGQKELWGGYRLKTNLLNLVFDAGFQQIFRPRTPQNRAAFYLLSGGATIQRRSDVLIEFQNTNSKPPPTEVGGGATRVRQRDAAFALFAGAGVRWYATDHFGIRAEVKTYFPVGRVHDPLVLVTGGIFFQIYGR